MSSSSPSKGTVYTETTVYSPPQQYVNDAPYQIAIIDLHETPADGKRRITARILASTPEDRVHIGEQVVFTESRNGVAYFRKAVASEP